MTALHAFATLHLLGIVAWLTLRLAGRIGASPRVVARIGHALIVLVPMLAVGAAWVDGPDPGFSPAKIENAPRSRGEVVIQVGRTSTHTLLDLQTTPNRIDAVVAVSALVVVVAAGRAAVEGVRLKRRLASTVAWRRIGSVELRLAHEGTFAVWWFGRRIVCVARDLVPDPDRLELAVRHELQHHRAGDPVAAWGLLGLRVLAGYAPWFEAWARTQESVEELACDAAVVARPGVDRPAYAHALLDAASRGAPSPLVTGFVPAPGPLLERRISMLTHPPRPRPFASALAVTLAALLVTGTAVASTTLVDDARLDDDALAEAVAAAADDAFPIPADGPVADRVRALAGSPRGRAYAQGALARRDAEHGAMVDDLLATYGLPPQLAAVPFVESGWANLPAAANPVGAAGLWQFMPETARRYGLRVDASTDQRLDPVLATHAACRLLRDLHAQYGDWGLALAAYNQGHQVVDGAIAAEGTRDVWALVEAGALYDYAAQVLAAAVVTEHPQILTER